MGHVGVVGDPKSKTLVSLTWTTGGRGRVVVMLRAKKASPSPTEGFQD